MRKSLLATILIACVWANPTRLLAQQAPGIPTTVQLPTFSYFSVNTSVSIPDSGGAYSEAARQARQRPSNGLQPAGANLGGITLRGAGPGGFSAAASGASVSATIHDHEPITNPAVGAVAAGSIAARFDAARASSAGRPSLSVAEARRLYAERKQSDDRSALELLKQGDAARERGNLAAAKLYYQSAARRASDPSRTEALARLHALESAAR